MKRRLLALLPVCALLSLYGSDLYLVAFAPQLDCSMPPAMAACCRAAEAGAAGAMTCCKVRCPAGADRSYWPQLASSILIATPHDAIGKFVPAPLDMMSHRVDCVDLFPSLPLYLRHSLLLI